MASLGMTNFSKAVRWFRRTARRVLPAPVRRGLWAGWVRSRALFRHLRLLPLRVKAIRLAKIAARRPRTPTQVVFVSDRPGSRVAKLAYGLQQAGWEVVLLHLKSPTFDASKYCVELHQYRNPWEALLLAARYTPVVYHLFSSWNFDVATTLIRHKPGKIVFDDYDVMAGMVKEDFARKHYPGQLELERFCLENADGLCCRSLETQHAKRRLGYRFKGSRLFFPDYMWSDATSANSEKPWTGRCNRAVVYCGNMPSSNRLSYIGQIAQRLAIAGWDLHLYPSYDRFQVPEKGASDQPSNLHIHSRQDCRVLIDKLSQYAVGLQIPNKLANRGAYTDVKRTYSMTGKMFDYLDAGLPVLIADQRVQTWLLRRYDAAIQLSVKKPLESLSSLKSSEVESARHGMDAARQQHLAIGVQIPRLIEFYQRVSESI